MSAGGTFNGVNYAKADAPSLSGMADGSIWNGTVKCMVDTAFAAGTSLGAGSVFNVGKLPQGAIPLFAIVTPIASTGIATATANAVTGLLGYTGDTNALGSVTTLAAAGAASQFIRPIPDGTVNTAMTPLTAETDVFLTTAAAELVAGEGIEVKIFYACA